MTCGGCVATVRKVLAGHPGVQEVAVTLVPPEAVVTTSAAIAPEDLNALLRGTHYAISATVVQQTVQPTSVSAEPTAKGLFTTYFPLLLVFVFITGLALSTSFTAGYFEGMRFMAHFMAGFFLAFSFFKLLDLQGFANSYRGYDLLAMRIPAYGYVYPFIELALGIAYLMGFDPLITNLVTIVVMGFSTIGVLRAVVNKQRIQCACLGTVFNLPMSTVTILEDLLMVAMAGAMLAMG
ncbi:MAG: heavy metal translocating P-type ATPase [Flavobacteriales bacterium]|nr:heavy metal translocating P-type ATPase [Flavobacteriales bacterium]